MLRIKRKLMFFPGKGNAIFYVTRSGESYAFGENSFGQLGIGNTEGPLFKVKLVEFFKKGTKLELKFASPSITHSQFLTVSGKAYSCGSNAQSRCSIGVSRSGSHPFPTEVCFEDEKVSCKMISAGYCSSYFLTVLGVAYAAGFNSHGELGLGVPDRKDVSVAKKVFLKEKVKGVFGGHFCAAFLSTSYEVFVCGTVTGGKLAVDTKDNLTTPTLLGIKAKYSNVKVQSIAFSDSRIFFLTKRGEMYTNGDLLGRREASSSSNPLWRISSPSVPKSTSSSSKAPVPCKDFGRVCEIAGDNINQIAFRTVRGEIYIPGKDYFNLKNVASQIIPPNQLNNSVARRVKVNQLRLNRYNSFVVMQDGSVYAKGDGSRGNLLQNKQGDLDQFRLIAKLDLKVMKYDQFGDEFGETEKAERLTFMVEKKMELYCCNGVVYFS